ncbi:MMPL family transporter [Streptomyces pathocidini]|uniref:MMPL family transporter n=1 Tax=Streptomyces pathocidini TaxID=1650571 RepID=UPI0033C29F3C
MARWCFRHKWTVILLWVLALGGVTGASGALGDRYADAFELPGTESAQVMRLMEKAFPGRSGEADTIVWHVDGPDGAAGGETAGGPDSGTVRDPGVRRAMSAALAEVAGLPDVGSVASPYEPRGGAQISRDGRTAYATVTFTKPGEELTAERMKAFVDAARAPARDGLAVEVGGNAVQLAEEPPAHLAELVGVVAAAVVLFLAFGSLYAMLLPIFTALFGVGVAASGIILLSHATDVPEVAPMLSMLVGLGVGIDYALFIVTRHRKGIQRGRTPEESAVQAVNTSGRAVLFAGGTVCIALLGMLALRLSFLDGMAFAAALTVVLTVAAAVTLLPALLGVLGVRVLSRRQRRGLAAHGPEPDVAEKGAAVRWSGFVQRHPRPLALLAVVVMAALAVPALSLRLGSSDQGNNPETTTTRQAYDLLAEGFGPGFNGPLTILAELRDGGGAGDTAASGDGQAELNRLAELARSTPGVARAEAVPLAPGATTGVVQVVPAHAPQSEETDELIDRLRAETVPAAERGGALRAYVGGQTAMFKDFAAVLTGKLPVFIGVIVALGFALLLVAFRSLVVPLTAAAMNLLAAAASFGALVAIFQWGWAGELLGGGREGPIEAFLPVIMGSLLFGLSMDYQVFLVSRMHEEWIHTGDNERAVRVGLAETSRVINSAAVIMICVFGAFLLSGERVMAMFGVGLAGAVALDAFILRTVLVPALMHLFSTANWWLPAWLSRLLPHLTVEPLATQPSTTQIPTTTQIPITQSPVTHAPNSQPSTRTTPPQPYPTSAPSPAPDPVVPSPRGRAVPPPSAVRGTVRTVFGEPVAGAVLTLVSRGGRQLGRTVAHPDGAYALAAPRPGSYLLVATAGTCEPRGSHVMIGESPLPHDVTLAPSAAGALN